MNFKTIKRKKLKYEIILVFLGVLWVIALIIGLALGIGIAVTLEDGDALELAFLPTALVSGAIYGVYVRFKKQSLKFKKMFVVNELQNMIPNVKYDPLTGLTRSDVFKTALVSERNGFETEDLIEGEIAGVSFRSSDLYVSERQRSKKVQPGTVYFLGQFFILNLKQNTDVPVYVISNNNSYFKVKKEYIKPELEWIKFNKQFNVYAASHIKALTMLTPRFMERLSNANDREKKTSFAFYEDKLYIAIHTNIDTFDLRLFRAVNKSFLNEIREQILFINEIINVLK